MCESGEGMSKESSVQLALRTEQQGTHIDPSQFFTEQSHNPHSRTGSTEP